MKRKGKQGGKADYTTGLKITGNRSDRGMNPHLKFLVQHVWKTSREKQNSECL